MKLKQNQALEIHGGYAWFKLRGRTTPGMDEAIKLIPDENDPSSGSPSKTLRIRGDQLKSMVELLKAVRPFVRKDYVIWQIVADFEKISVADALADAAR